MLSPLCPSPPESPREGSALLLDARLPAQADLLGAARECVEQAARTFGLDERACFDFVFAVNEAVTNALRYGTHGKEGTIGLRIHAEGNVITASVSNRGTFLPASGCLDLWSERGRGLHYMRVLVDDVRVQSTPMGTAVHLRKALAPAGAEEA